jgi:hypothetical protein
MKSIFGAQEMNKAIKLLRDQSGWHFFAGDESQDYADNSDNFSIYEVNTICNYDPAIIPYLDSNPGSAFGRIEGTDIFAPEELSEVQDEE